MKQGLVIKNTGSFYVVRTPDGDELNCKIKGNLRLRGFRCTNPVAVGDQVSIIDTGDDGGYIKQILPRRNYLIRRASNLSKEFQILGANLDLAVLVVTLAEPATPITFVDRFLASCEAYNVTPLVVFNKVDLLTQSDDQDLLEAVTYLYRSIGYDVLHTSVLTGEGIGELVGKLKDKTALFSGNSGVGKSSLINTLVPDANLRVGDMSAAHHTGMHTTTFSNMLDLPGGGQIIDTPGVKGFGTIDFNAAEVGHYFPEIFKESKNCRFGNCTHTHEPGCAVLQAVEESRISQSRYTSYMSILTDDQDDKYRKPF